MFYEGPTRWIKTQAINGERNICHYLLDRGPISQLHKEFSKSNSKSLASVVDCRWAVPTKQAPPEKDASGSGHFPPTCDTSTHVLSMPQSLQLPHMAIARSKNGALCRCPLGQAMRTRQSRLLITQPACKGGKLRDAKDWAVGTTAPQEPRASQRPSVSH